MWSVIFPDHRDFYDHGNKFPLNPVSYWTVTNTEKLAWWKKIAVRNVSGSTFTKERNIGNPDYIDIVTEFS